MNPDEVHLHIYLFSHAGLRMDHRLTFVAAGKCMHRTLIMISRTRSQSRRAEKDLKGEEINKLFSTHEQHTKRSPVSKGMRSLAG